MLTAKAVVSGLINNGNGQTTVQFRGDYDDPMNKEWAKWTPVFNLQMVVKDELVNNFKHNQSFTVTFNPA